MTSIDSNPPPGGEQSGAGALLNDANSEALGLLVWLGQLNRDGSLSRPGASDAPACLGYRLGHFQLEALLGTGAYGAVFRAMDTNLDRCVALKIAWPAVLLDPEASRRFVDEPKTIAGIRHPGIVQVFESGSIDFVRFISFELIEGPTLGEWAADQGQLPIRDVARLMGAVAEAICFAHERGIVHRDLKPSNILLRSGSHSGHQPVVTDFGLARRAGTQNRSDATATIAFVGTDRYMSPEQAAGLASEVGLASDLFSLGVILYELLAGARPFDGESAEQIRAKIQRDDPPPLRALRRGIPRDLETIVLKCLEKSPCRRYGSARELADDLRGFVEHRPIKARPASLGSRAWRFARRNPRLVSMVSSVVLGVVAISILMGMLIEERRSAAREVALAQAAAAAAEGMERQHQYAKTIQSAAKAQVRGDRAESLRFLNDASDLARPPVRRGIEWNLLSAFNNAADPVLRANFGGVRAARFSPTQNLLVSGGSDNRLIFWDTATWKPRRSVFNTGRAVKSVEFCADGSLLAVGGENGRVVVHRLADEAVVFDQKLIEGRVFDIAWLAEDRVFAAGGEDGVLWIVDPLKNQTRQSAPLEPSPEARAIDPEHPNEIVSLAFLPERKMLAVLKAPAEILMIDPDSFEIAENWGNEITVSGVGAMCRAEHGSTYLALGGAHEILLYDATTRAVAATMPFSQGVEELQFCPAGQKLVACCRDGSAHAWQVADLLAGRPERGHIAVGHGSRALSVGISPDGRWMATGGRDGTVRVWNSILAAQSFETPLVHQPLAIEFSDCGRWLAFGEQTADNQSLVSVFDVRSGKKLWSTGLPSRPEAARGTSLLPLFPFAFHPEGNEVALSPKPGRFETRNSATGDVIRGYSTSAMASRSVKYSGDGNEFIVGGAPRIAIVDRVSGKTLSETTEAENLLSFPSPSGELWFHSTSRGCALRSSLESVPRNLGSTDERISAAELSTDGRFLAGGGRSPEIYVWDLQTAKRFRLAGEGGAIDAVRFSRDGHVLLSLNTDGQLKLWHLPTRSELLTIGSADDRVLCFGIHPSDQMLILGVKHCDSHGLRVYRFGSSDDLTARFELTSPGGESP